MAFDAERVETITVDSFGTLVDPSAAETALAAHVEEPEPISNLWRSRSLMYTMVGNFVDAYQPFYEVNCLGVKWFETPPASRHHGRSKIFRTTPRLVSGLPL